MVQKAIVILCFIAFDILTGWMKAVQTTGYNSTVMREGMWHKLAELCACGFCAFADWSLPMIDFNLPLSLYSCIIVYISLMEITSIVENIGQTFPDLGKYLSAVFEKVDNNIERNDKR